MKLLLEAILVLEQGEELLREHIVVVLKGGFFSKSATLYNKGPLLLLPFGLCRMGVAPGGLPFR